MKNVKLYFFLLFLVLLNSCNNKNNSYSITDFGAIGDGKTLNTEAIQKAIDKCTGNGGGTVIIPSGEFLSGTIYMKNNVMLHLEEGALLKGSASFDDYPDNKVNYVNSFSYPSGKLFENKALIFGEGLTNISITGSGTIDGNGDSPTFQLGNDSSPESRRRPSVILFIDCKNITVSGLHLRNSAYWMQNYLGCDGLNLSGLNIYNHTNFNQDAMDIDAKNVLIENCVIDADDDGVCLKSHDVNRPVENVTVRNCIISTNCNAVKFGTKSDGGFKNINISNCVIKKASEDNVRQWQKNLEFIELPTTVISGFALESVDGGFIENVNISDILMFDVQTPIFIIQGRRNVGQAGNDDFYASEKNKFDESLLPGKVSGIHFKNIMARSHSKMTSSVTAFPGNYIENITFDNITFSTMGYGTLEEANTPLMENPHAYPENRMFGYVYPASGLYLRRVKDVTLNNLDLHVRNKDYRPAIILDDVHNIDIKSLTADTPAGNNPVIRTEKSSNIKNYNPEISMITK
ncbi:glycoside hydrolase family 28 protein [Dysgonomonas sp. 520]|uniref:glycoside hydrolase family 28 protein n=1 Tax=Dysgonomonas sp. 520 TaxID=2302931 RepID=UPI0013D75495|nr:glycosyl hydrolase family 28 protein [Dysgonomonas sp. 520]NDW11147.1 glycoside hydrolase family 28 protein [Dysgonomonas sp. 520]